MTGLSSQASSTSVVNQAHKLLAATSIALKKNPSTLAAARTQLLKKEEPDRKDTVSKAKIVNEYAAKILIMTKTHDKIMCKSTQGLNCGNDFAQLGNQIKSLQKYFPVIA